MKRIIITILVALLAISMASAQAVVPTLVARDAKTMATGGCFAATSWGYGSFFGNPAGFAAPKGQFTLANLSVWGYVKPDEANQKNLETITSNVAKNEEKASAASGLIVNGGLGFGASAGLGWAGRGIGLGAFAIADAYASGEKILGATLNSAIAVNAVAGLGLNVIKLPGLGLAIGADVRPFYRVDAAGDNGWLVSQFIAAMSSQSDDAAIQKVVMAQKVNAGFGLAFDAGAQLTLLDSITVGLSIRDLTPTYMADTVTLKDLSEQFSAGSFMSSTGTYKGKFLPAVYAGLSWTPRLIPFVLEPAFYFEIQNPVAIIKNNASIWNLMHAGVDVKLLSLLNLRAGINSGYYSAGVGVNLLFLEANAAVFTEELGLHPGDKGRTGVSAQVVIRF